MPVGDQDVVADRADGFEGAAPAPDGVIPRTQIGVLGACGGLCRLGEHRLERDRSVAGASVRALPPEALLPGHIPAQDARCAGVANTLMSTPISAIMPIAHLRATPGSSARAQ